MIPASCLCLQANDFGGEIIPQAAELGLNVMAYPFYGYWEDIGTIKSFFEENLKLCRHVSHTSITIIIHPS